MKDPEIGFTDKFHFKLILKYLSAHKAVFSILIVMMILNVSLAMTGPLIINYIVEIVEQNLNGAEIDINIELAIAAYVVFSLLSWVFAVVQFIFVAKLNARFIRDLRIDAYQNLINNNVSFFDQQRSGDLTSRIVNDTKELADSGNSIAWVFTSLLRLILVVGVFFYFSPIIAIAALSFLPIVFGISIILGKYERRVSAVWRDRFGEVNSRFQEIMSKISISKAFNREKENLDRFQTINEETYQASVKRGFAIFIFWPMTDLMKHMLTLLILAVGTWQVQQGMPIATLVLFIILINYYYWPMITIANNYHRFQGAFASLSRISHISFNPEFKNQNDGNIEVDQLVGNINFDDVTFGYDPELPVLHDLNFSIKQGQRVALVGHTGAGKSTIASLLIGFYPISMGSVTIDGIEIEDYKIQNYREHISLVSQRVLLFKGTLRENLTISDQSISDEKIWEILELVEAKDFIELLPNGLDTVIEENGKNLSAGQRQMISFARALLANPDVVLLDEATAAVDLFTEAKIQDAIDVILEGRTSISIAHRLTTILKSDLIIVLEHGRIVEMGNHDELIASDGLYKELYDSYLQTQTAKYLTKIKH